MTALTDATPFAVGSLRQLDALGALSPGRVMLSTPVTIPSRGFGMATALFSGANRVVIATAGRAYDIAIPSGVVRDLGAFTLPPRAGCESWATWGVAEFFGSQLYVTYVRDNTSIVRTAVPSGATTAVGTFANLSDMCSFTVDPAGGRWYFHHEGTSQFGGADESIGFCPASFAGGSATLNFPTVNSNIVAMGFANTLAAANAAGRRFWNTGDYIEETVASPIGFTSMTLSLPMNDVTAGCASGQTLSFNVSVNGTTVGAYSFPGGSGVNPRNISQTFSVPARPAGASTFRITAATTVCSGGGAWIWGPGTLTVR
jgi:hypothetical protein